MTEKRGYKIRADGKKDTGRPTKLTPETIDKLEYAFALGCSDLEACYYAGIGKTVLYNYQNQNPDFVDRKNILKKRPMFKARTAIIQAITDGDVATARWYAERKAKDEFSTKIETTSDVTVQKVYITEEQRKAAGNHIDMILRESYDGD